MCDCRNSVIACAKHFVGDGGTDKGINEGNAICTFDELERIHISPYLNCLSQGVSTVMVSYSKWNGSPLHANRFLVNDILKGKLGFKVLTFYSIGTVVTHSSSLTTHLVLFLSGICDLRLSRH